MLTYATECTWPHPPRLARPLSLGRLGMARAGVGQEHELAVGVNAVPDLAGAGDFVLPLLQVPPADRSHPEIVTQRMLAGVAAGRVTSLRASVNRTATAATRMESVLADPKTLPERM
jgi:hypothetical protein